MLLQRIAHAREKTATNKRVIANKLRYERSLREFQCTTPRRSTIAGHRYREKDRENQSCRLSTSKREQDPSEFRGNVIIHAISRERMR